MSNYQADISNQETRPMRGQARHEGWGGCFAVTFSLLGVMICVMLSLGGMAARHFPRTLDRYLSLEPGQASLYRVTYQNGEEGFYSINVIKPDNNAIVYSAVLGKSGGAIQVHTVATHWNGLPGQVHSWDDYYSRDGQILELIAHLETGKTTEFLPPIPVWSPALFDSNAANPLTGETVFDNASIAYTLWLDGQEMVTLPNGQETEAVRIGLDFFLEGSKFYHSLVTYANGVGQVYGEEFDGDNNLLSRLELLASTRLTGTVSLPLDDLLADAAPTTSLFRENAARTGAHPDVRLPDTPFNVAYRLTRDANFTASPAIASGLLIAADQNGTVFGLDATTAAVRWQFGLGGAVTSAPAVANGLVYVGGSDKMLYALNAKDGLFVWSFKLRDNLSTSPVVSNGLLIFGAEDRTLYALDALTGLEKWRFTAGDRILSSPAEADGHVFFGADDGVLYAVELETGIELWRTALDAPIVASPAVEGGVVYAGSIGTEFAAFQVDTGESIWRSVSSFGYKASPSLGEQLVFVADDDGVIRALQKQDGQVMWTWRTPSGANFVSSPLLLGPQLVIVDSEGVLTGLDASTGTVIQSLSLGVDGVTGSPTWDGSTLYLTTQDMQVLALTTLDALEVAP